MTIYGRNFMLCTSAMVFMAAAAPASAQSRSFDIPAQSVDTAIGALGRQADVQIAASRRTTRGKQANAVRGEMTVQHALTRLLAGTGLMARQTGPRTFSILADAESQRLGNGNSGVTQEPAQLATVNASPSGENDMSTDEDIVVTAERRQQRLSDAPLSVSVIGAHDIARHGLTERSDYLRTIPSVSLRDDGPGQAEIVIRGAYGDAFRTGPTVGLYLNDVPLTGFVLGGSADVRLIDMDRVEILRGPQGTLYGSNALSGAIKYVTASPDLDRRSTDLEFGYSRTGKFGGDNHYGQVVLNVPLVKDRLAIRAVAFRQLESGYVRGTAGADPAIQAARATFGGVVNDGRRLGDSESWGVRLSARWQPSDQLNFDLMYAHQTDAQDDRLFELAKDGPYRRADFQLASIVGGPEDALKIDLDLVNLRADFDLGFGSLYSSTAKMKQRYLRKFEIGTILPGGLRPASQASDTDAGIFTQELRFTSAFRGPIQVIGGLYYEDSDQPTLQQTFFGGDPARNPYSALLLYQFDLDRVVKQKAAFGEVSFTPIDGLTITGGARAFQYRSRFATISSKSVVSFVVPSASDIRTKESGQTYKARVEYKPSRDVLFYGSFSQGFRLGRPLATDLIRSLCDKNNDGLLDGTDISSRLDRVSSDKMDSYEAGAKLNVRGRGAVSAAVYQNNWKGLPIAFQPPQCLTNTTINGGTARARGIELEGNFSLFDGLRTNFGLGYVDSKLTSTTSLGAAGAQLNFTPKLNASAGIEYNFAVGDAQAFVRGDYTYFGSYYTQTGKRGIRADDYNLVNLSAGLNFADGLRLQVHVDNLFDSNEFTSVLGPSGFPAGYGVRLRPRTIGMRIGYAFR